MRMIDAEKLKDVLENVKHHLEAYPNVLASYKACVMSLIDIVNAQPTITPPPNDPLTLEELREMDGEPVFIKCLFNDELSLYVVVDKRRDSAGIFTRLFYASFDYYGDEWLAYRRRPEEGTT